MTRILLVVGRTTCRAIAGARQPAFGPRVLTDEADGSREDFEP